MFNPIKSVCVVFKSNGSKLYCPTVSLVCDILEYTAYTKYLGFTFSMNVQNDADMLIQMRTLCIRSNKLFRTFYHGAILTLNWNYSKVFVPHFTVVIYGLHTKNLHLWNYGTGYPETFYVVWRKVTRLIEKLPFRTHCNLLHTINNGYPIEFILEKRCIIYLHSYLQCMERQLNN